jgi:hypothetical protein
MKIEKLPVNSEVLVHLKNIESPDGRSTSIINPNDNYPVFIPNFLL